MNPDVELLAEALGAEPSLCEPVNTRGYTRSRAWRVEAGDGPLFVKQADEEGSLEMLRREAIVYRGVAGTFLPALAGFADSGERGLLAIEYLEDVCWPPPYPDDVSPLFEALELVAETPPPAELPAEAANESQWRKVASDPKPFLDLGLCSHHWFEHAIDDLVAAEDAVEVEGNELVHNDVYSANLGFRPAGAVLVDWGAAVRGSRWVDVAFALLSLRVEGATAPPLAFPGRAALVATIAGHFAVGAPGPLPAWANPSSSFLEDIRGDLDHLLRWCAEELGLPPPLP